MSKYLILCGARKCSCTLMCVVGLKSPSKHRLRHCSPMPLSLFAVYFVLKKQKSFDLFCCVQLPALAAAFSSTSALSNLTCMEMYQAHNQHQHANYVTKDKSMRSHLLNTESPLPLKSTEIGCIMLLGYYNGAKLLLTSGI